MLRGDSTMYGSHPGEYNGNVPDQTPANPTALMQADFDKAMPGLVTVIDRAEPGSYLANDLDGTGPYTSGTLAHELAANPSVNLVVTNSEIVDYTLSTVTEYGKNLATWISTVRAAGMTPWIEEPNPVCAVWSANATRSAADFLACLDSVRGAAPQERDDGAFLTAQRTIERRMATNAIPLYDAFLAQPHWMNLLQADRMHPTDEGYRFKEAQAFRYLEPAVEAMLESKPRPEKWNRHTRAKN
jgi:lysophospholipase L1-like esterase